MHDHLIPVFLLAVSAALDLVTNRSRDIAADTALFSHDVSLEPVRLLLPVANLT